MVLESSLEVEMQNLLTDRFGVEAKASSASPLLEFGVIAQRVEDLGALVLGKFYSLSWICCSNY